MRGLRGTLLAVGAGLGVLDLAGLVEIGCGDTSSGSQANSRADATADGRGESGSDSGVPELATDAGGDVGKDGPPEGLVFAINQATANCTRFLNCCPGGLDGGTYDLQQCVNRFMTFGWEGTLPPDPHVYSRGHITVDEGKATKCISAINSFPCGTQTATEYGAITSACELVIQGTMPSNSGGCISSFECAPGNYCDPTVDGGLCTPLATRGQPCNTKINSNLSPIPDQMCSYLGSGQPALFCDLINNPADAATCQPLLPNGASCSNGTSGYLDDQACAPPKALCGDNLTCGAVLTGPYPAFCQYYEIQDAGGPG